MEEQRHAAQRRVPRGAPRERDALHRLRGGPRAARLMRASGRLGVILFSRGVAHRHSAGHRRRAAIVPSASPALAVRRARRRAHDAAARLSRSRPLTAGYTQRRRRRVHVVIIHRARCGMGPSAQCDYW